MPSSVTRTLDDVALARASRLAFADVFAPSHRVLLVDLVPRFGLDRSVRAALDAEWDPSIATALLVSSEPDVEPCSGLLANTSLDPSAPGHGRPLDPVTSESPAAPSDTDSVLTPAQLAASRAERGYIVLRVPDDRRHLRGIHYLSWKDLWAVLGAPPRSPGFYVRIASSPENNLLLWNEQGLRGSPPVHE